MQRDASECEAGQRGLEQVKVWWCGQAARAALCLGYARQSLLDVLSATGPGDLAALVARGGTAHSDLLHGNWSHPSPHQEDTLGGINSATRASLGIFGCRLWAPG